MEQNNSDKMHKFLEKQAGDLGIGLSDKQLQQFLSYYLLLEEYNKVMNLTAVTGPEEVAMRHFIDSMAPLMLETTNSLLQKPGIQLLDLGTGAGFPGMPLAISLPGIEVTLADSLQKRTNFLCQVKEKNEMKNVTIVTGRAEDLARDENMREQYDIVVSRAVADLPVLCEYCLPFVKPDGFMIAWKGPAAKEEISRAENAISILGGAEPEILTYTLPGIQAERHLLTIRKETFSPDKYPRRAGIPAKRPL